MNVMFDNRTQTLVQAAVSAMLCLVMLIAWRTQKTYPGFSRWTLSRLPNALGFLLISFRGMIPDWASIFVANILLFISPILLYEGIRKFLGKPYRDTLHYFFVGLLVTGFTYFLWVKPSVNARLMLISGLSSIVLLRCAWNLFTQVSPPLRPSYWFTATLCAVAGIGLVLRFFTLAALPEISTPFIFDQWQNYLFLGIIVVPIGWTFGFFMMTNARLTLELQWRKSDYAKWLPLII